MERRKRAGLPAAAAAGALGICLMLGLFAAEECGYRPLETLPPSLMQTGTGHPVSGRRLDINTATREQLDALPGIGPVRAAAILAWREEHGPFRFPEELLEVPGIGEKTLENLMGLIMTGGD